MDDGAPDVSPVRGSTLPRGRNNTKNVCHVSAMRKDKRMRVSPYHTKAELYLQTSEQKTKKSRINI